MSELFLTLFRYEKAWQTLFYKESKIAEADTKIIPAGKQGRLVIGHLLIINNIGVPIFHPRTSEEPLDGPAIPFEEFCAVQGGNLLQDDCAGMSYLIFGMDYEVKIIGESKILGRESPTSDVKFYPFRRQLTTKGECRLDDWLFLELLKPFLQTVAKGDVEPVKKVKTDGPPQQQAGYQIEVESDIEYENSDSDGYDVYEEDDEEA